MSSPEVRQPMPADYPETEPLELPANRVEVALGNYNPNEKQVINNWEVLDDIAQGGEDLKLKLIESLGKDDMEVMAEAKAAKEDAAGDNTKFKGISHAFVLRKMMIGHDWRTEQVAARAHDYIVEKKRLLVRQVQALNRQPKTEKISATIKALREKFLELSDQQQNLDQIIATGYPRLQEKMTELKQTTRAEKKVTTSAAPVVTPEEEADVVLADVMANGAIGLREEEKENPDTKQESAAEKEHAARLGQAVEQKLPKEYKNCAPEIARLLKDSGFDFVERDDFTTQGGKTQEVTRFILFVDQAQTEAANNFPSASNQNFERALPKFTDEFRTLIRSLEVSTKPEENARIKVALKKLFTRPWDYASQTDATAILEHLRAQDEKPHAMYIKKGIGTNFNLAAIGKESGQIILHVQSPNQAPKYTDETAFSSAPVFTFDINRESKKTK